jgi:hypothetical protein
MTFLRLPARIARRLARKAVKPIALRFVELQMLASEARESDCITARGVTVPMKRYEQQRQVELIARRNVIRGW